MAIFQQTGIILLAGGKSSRMGQDKGLMSLNGKPMVQFILDTAKKISDTILIVANNADYNQFGYPVYADDFFEKGPLAGLYTGLKNSTAEYNLVLSCDIPFIHEGVLEFLIESSTGYDCTISESAGKMHPLVGVYRKSCLPVIERKLHANQLKVTGIFDELSIRIVDMANFLPENFRNINSPADL
ncbi:MAG: molybdenum cofactor guanylyltransferase [Bacteroidetes bacterium]|nr:molybdenum cofactor guanylyltransferase [Bacteroidota bacterium]